MPSNVLCWVLICIAVLGSACTSTTQNPTQQPSVSQTTTTVANVASTSSSTTALIDEPSDTAPTSSVCVYPWPGSQDPSSGIGECRYLLERPG